MPSRPIVVPFQRDADGQRDALSAMAPAGSRLMWITPDRVFYAGLLGAMSTRTMGGWLLYASLGGPLRVRLDRGPDAGQWLSTDLAVVPPYVPHRVASDDRLVLSVTLEPESMDPDALPQVLRGPGGPRDDDALTERLREAYRWLCQVDRGQVLAAEDFDARVFGWAVTPRRIEPRIQRVLSRMRADPASALSAADSAELVGLSCSRFLHLFKEQVGASFRNVRTWKRARSLLHHVNRPANLAHMALDRGYPDSTHFSHSIRQIYGLTPRDLFAGSRRLTLLGEAPRGR